MIEMTIILRIVLATISLLSVVVGNSNDNDYEYIVIDNAIRLSSIRFNVNSTISVIIVVIFTNILIIIIDVVDVILIVSIFIFMNSFISVCVVNVIYIVIMADHD